jgi:hypothetical protein
MSSLNTESKGPQATVTAQQDNSLRAAPNIDNLDLSEEDKFRFRRHIAIERGLGRRVNI